MIYVIYVFCHHIFFGSELQCILNNFLKLPLPHFFFVFFVCIRSSFVAWKYPSQGSSVTDMDYFSFLFSTLTGNQYKFTSILMLLEYLEDRFCIIYKYFHLLTSLEFSYLFYVSIEFYFH